MGDKIKRTALYDFHKENSNNVRRYEKQLGKIQHQNERASGATCGLNFPVHISSISELPGRPTYRRKARKV